MGVQSGMQSRKRWRVVLVVVGVFVVAAWLGYRAATRDPMAFLDDLNPRKVEVPMYEDLMHHSILVFPSQTATLVPERLRSELLGRGWREVGPFAFYGSGSSYVHCALAGEPGFDIIGGARADFSAGECVVVVDLEPSWLERLVRSVMLRLNRRALPFRVRFGGLPGR